MFVIIYSFKTFAGAKVQQKNDMCKKNAQNERFFVVFVIYAVCEMKGRKTNYCL